MAYALFIKLNNAYVINAPLWVGWPSGRSSPAECLRGPFPTFSRHDRW